MSEELVEIEKVRGYGYKLLSVLYGLPQKEWQDNKIIDDLQTVLEALNVAGNDDVRKLKETFETITDFEELQAEYAKLFVGPCRLLVPPYGSVYLEGRRIMGDSTMAAIDFYEEVGVKLSEKIKEVPDHIKVQLEVMYYLLFKESLAVQNGDEAAADEFAQWQVDFFNVHFMSWALAFTNELAEKSEHDFYLNLARVTTRFLTDEKSRMVQ